MTGNIVTALKLGAAVFLTVALITIVVGIFTSSTEPTKASKEEFNNLTTELKDSKFVQYDEATVSGSEVISAVRRFAKEGEAGLFGISVKTGQNTTGTWYYNTVSDNGDTISTSTSSAKSVSDQASTQYVNSAASFKSILVRDSSNVIRAIKFTQIK